jgi:hypothetical protein
MAVTITMSNGSAAIAHGVLMRLHRLRRGLRNKGTPMIKTVAALLAAGIVFTAPAQAEEIAMEPEAIAALFPGHYEARVAGGYKLMIAAKEDGSMMGRAFGREDKGQWKLEENRLCVAWRSWTSGKFKCGSIAQNGDWFVATSEKGDKTMKFRAVDKRTVMSTKVGRRAASDR